VAYQGLIAFAGSGRPELDRAAECAVVESVLASGKTCFHVMGTGARVRAQNSVVVSGGEAFFLDPGPAPDAWRSLTALLPWLTVNTGGELLLTASLPAWWPLCDREVKYAPRGRFNTQVLLERNTLALRGSLIRLADAFDLTRPAADAYVVQAAANVFADPFQGSPRRSGLLLCEADALTHGLLVWRGDGNVYDSGFRYFVGCADRLPDAAQPFSVWTRLWGSASDVQAVPLDLPAPDRKLNLDDPRTELLVPVYVRARIKASPPGSDLIKPPAPVKKK
jgi:hypothetical protein